MSRRSTASKEANGSADPTTKSQEKQAMLLAQDTGHFSLFRAMHLADLITELNGFCGFMSILSSMRYCLGDPKDHTNLWIALGFMPFGLFFDFFDGKVARWRKKSSLMGQELDSLADLVTFGVAPAACGFAMGFRSFLDTIILTFYVLSGLTRLARFNVSVNIVPKDKSGKAAYFEGTPIPFACLTVSTMLATILTMDQIQDQIPFGIALSGTPFEFHPVLGLYVLMACLMVSKTLHVPKP